MKRVVFIFLLCITSVAFAQEKPSEKKYEMKTYYLVFLKKGPNQTQDTTTLRKLQEGHMAHLNKMADAGKMDLAGPIMKKDSELRGICVYNVATKEEAEKLVNEDPMVKAGRLIAEILPWYSAKGASLK